MEYKRHKYPDGGVYAEITNFDNPVIVERINNYEDLFFIKSLKDVCDNLGHKEIELVIPCMFQQQHDRRFYKNQSFELKLVCDFINSCNFTKVKVFHPHSDVTPALLNNCEVIDNSDFVNEVISKIRDERENDYPAYYLQNQLILMSSDAGGFKPLIKTAELIQWQGDTYSASKARDPKSHKLTQIIDRQDFGGKDILIIDDLCVFGGTFIGLAKMLKERNVGKLYLAISHLTVPNPNPDLFLAFDKVFTTNSKGLEYGIFERMNLEIINLF